MSFRSVSVRLLPICRVLAVGSVLLGVLGCRDKQTPTVSSAQAEAPSAPAPAARAVFEDERGRYDFIDNLGSCHVEHRGLFLDLGAPGTLAFRGFSVTAAKDSEHVDREGATFERVFARELRYDIWLDAPQKDLRLSTRIHGAGAKMLYVGIDDKRVGAIRLTSGETKIANFPTLSSELGRGRHRLSLRFSGAPRGPKQAQAEIDWLRLGAPDEATDTYAAPTHADIVSDVVLQGIPKRSIVLRSPGVVRCSLRPSKDAQLRLALGFWGAGQGTAELRVVSDSDPPVVLQTHQLSGGDAAKWTPVSLNLEAFAGRVIGLELRATQGTRGGRIAFGDPMVTRRAPSNFEIPEAKTAILVIASGIDRRRVPPWGPTKGFAALGELARTGVAFSRYRAPTTVPAGIIASMLTGLSPRHHTVEATTARLPGPVRTIPEIIKEASGRTAMYTSSPTTFAAFGFDAGWDVYESFSPVHDVSANEPFARAAKWLERELEDERSGPRFVLIHARGGHPPWDLTREEVGALKPDEYGGPMDARRGGIHLASLRARRKNQRRLQDDDWIRLRALSEAAWAKQDTALEQVFALLKRKGAWDSTLVIVASDVGPGEAPEVPFDPAGPLTEDRLVGPLLVKFPGNALAGKEVLTPSGAEDVAVTILHALRLSPKQLKGHDLFAQASDYLPVAGTPQIALLPGRYTTRFGEWLLRGEFGKIPMLCQLDIDPACVNDVLNDKPLAAQAAWRVTFAAETEEQPARTLEKQAANVDPDTLAGLTVWGDVP